MAKDRNIRRLINTKEDSINIQNSSSLNNMADGQISMSKNPNKPLAIYRKKFGRLWKSYMSADGNDIVDKNLTVGGNLNVKGHIVGNTFKIIAHNMKDEINTAEVFLPWFGVSEFDDLTGQSSSFLVPYSMTLKKIMFRPSAISTNAGAELTVRLKKMDDRDTTVDTVATAVFSEGLAGDAFFVVNKSDFDNNPKFEIGDNCGISIQAASDYGGEIVWKITSVWEIEIKI